MKLHEPARLERDLDAAASLPTDIFRTRFAGASNTAEVEIR